MIKLAGVLGASPDLRLTANGNAVATLIVYTNDILRNDDGSTRQESERHRVIVWGLHAEKVARLLRKGSKIRVLASPFQLGLVKVKSLPNFKGGKVEVSTPKGKVEVELSDAFTMLVSSMTIELQNGVRDTLFPKDEQAKDGKASKTGYQG